MFDFFVSICYVTFLGVIGTLMLIESANTIRKARGGRVVSVRRSGQHNWIHGLPLKMRFHRSKLYISAIPPFLLGAFVGLLAAIMGVGGGFIMVPAMIYLLRVPTNVVIGTSLFQIVFVTAATTVLHATQNQTVDMVLAVLLMVGGVIGAQFGAVAGEQLKGEQLRFLLAALVLLVCLRFAWQLVAPPSDLYSLSRCGRRRLMHGARWLRCWLVALLALSAAGTLLLAGRRCCQAQRRRRHRRAGRQGGAAQRRRRRSSASSSRAPRESVQADVSARNVAVTSSFNGTEIVIFGAVDNSQQPSAESGYYDVVDRGGRRAGPHRGAAQEQRRRALAQHLLGCRSTTCRATTPSPPRGRSRRSRPRSSARCTASASTTCASRRPSARSTRSPPRT